MLLEVEHLSLAYQSTQALQDVSLSLRPGEIVAVLGANGAGKSSLLKCIQGLVPAQTGRVQWKGQALAGLSAAQRVKSGLVLVPEGRQIFVSMTVHDNLLMGCYTQGATPQREINDIYDRFPNLAKRRDMLASVLSGGEQQMLAISRALLSKPTVMMLDEPSLGLSPLLVIRIFELIQEMNRDGLGILLVEQNTHLALNHAHRAYVLELGRVALEGAAHDLISDPRMVAAYLGS
jgi:branched-chain amino acid transport system ATP-binding protein